MRRPRIINCKKAKGRHTFRPRWLIVVAVLFNMRAFRDGHRPSLMTLGRLGEEGRRIKGRGESRTEAGWTVGRFLHLHCIDRARQKGRPPRTLTTATCGGCKGRPLEGVGRVGGRASVKRASSRCATEADGAAGVVFVLTQQIFESNRGLEGEK